MSLLDFLSKTDPSNVVQPKRPLNQSKSEKDMSLMDFLTMEPPKTPEGPTKRASPATQGTPRSHPGTPQRKASTLSGEEEDLMDANSHANSVPMVPQGFTEASVVEVVHRLISTDAAGTLNAI